MGSVLRKAETHEYRPILRTVIVARDFIKTVLPVQTDRILQERECIQQENGITDIPRVSDHFFDQLSADAVPPEFRTYIEPFHLSGLRIQLSQADAAGRMISETGKVQPAVRRTIFFAQMGQLFFIILDLKICFYRRIFFYQIIRIFREQLSDLL